MSTIPPATASESVPVSRSQAQDTAADIIDIIQSGDPKRERDAGHRFCANCFAQIREVEPPKPDREFFNRWGGVEPHIVDGALDCTETTIRFADSPETAEASIGFAYPTDQMTPGVVERRQGSETYRSALVCKCGATKHSTVDRPVPKHIAVRYARNLSDTIETLRDEARQIGRLEHRVSEWRHSRDVLVETVRSLKERRDMQGQKPIFKAALAVALRRPDE